MWNQYCRFLDGMAEGEYILAMLLMIVMGLAIGTAVAFWLGIV